MSNELTTVEKGIIIAALICAFAGGFVTGWSTKTERIAGVEPQWDAVTATWE